MREDEGRVRVDGSWFGHETEDSTIVGITCASRLMELAVSAFYVASAGDGVVNMGGIMRVHRGRGSAMAVICVGSAILTSLAASFFHNPASSASRGFAVGIEVTVYAAVAVVVSKVLTLEGDSTMAAFLLCAFLVD